MITSEAESRSVLKAGKPWCELLPEADGSVDEWDSAMICGSFEESGEPVVVEAIPDAVYILVAFQ